MSDSDHSKPFFTYSETARADTADALWYGIDMAPLSETSKMDVPPNGLGDLMAEWIRFELSSRTASGEISPPIYYIMKRDCFPVYLESMGKNSEDCGNVVTFEYANPLPEPKPMEAKVTKNSRGTSEITISVGYSSENMLVPEARRFMSQLSEAIKQAERDNKPAPKHPWE